MKNLLPLAVITVSILTGAGLAFHEQVYDEAESLAATFTTSESSHDHGDHAHSNESSGFEFGSTHEHALLYVIVNGSEMDFREDRYQLAEDYVHLENNRSHIVHKHAEGVTWNNFFDTINASVDRQDGELCLDVKNVSSCGDGTVWMNGELNASLEKEIDQGDRTVIVLGGNISDTLSKYYSRQLPRAYSPESSRGRQL